MALVGDTDDRLADEMGRGYFDPGRWADRAVDR
jgi:hypothetical protein